MTPESGGWCRLDCCSESPKLILAQVLRSGLINRPRRGTSGFSITLGEMLLWGIVYATQDTLFKAVLAGVLPEGRRNLGFGLFYIAYGGGWLVGSIAAGLLYGQIANAPDCLLDGYSIDLIASVCHCAPKRIAHALRCPSALLSPWLHCHRIVHVSA